MTLNTRKPTGAVPWPLILIEGGEKTGKSYACAVLSSSKLISRTLWLDLGEGAADEYGAVPGARYEVIEHDGSWASIVGQVVAAKEEAQRAAAAGEAPVVLVLDSITAEWEMLKDWASGRARKTDANKRKLERDPNAEIVTSMNFWNDAANRHRKLMATLMTFPGIVVVTARGGEVAAVEGGKPVEGKKSYRVEGHKSLAFDASMWLRLQRGEQGLIVGGRSVHLQFRPDEEPRKLAKEWTLESIIFDVLKCEPAKAHVRDMADTQQDELTPEQIRDEAVKPVTAFARIRELHALAVSQRYEDVIVISETGDDENLLNLLVRIGNERNGGGRAAPAQRLQSVAPAATGPVPAGHDEGAEATWAAEYLAGLAVTTQEGIGAKPAEVRTAKRQGILSPQVFNELMEATAKRRDELAQSSAA